MFQFNFSMVTTRGSRSGAHGMERPGLGDDETSELITTNVTVAVREAISELFGSNQTTMIKMFDEH